MCECDAIYEEGEGIEGGNTTLNKGACSALKDSGLSLQGQPGQHTAAGPPVPICMGCPFPLATNGDRQRKSPYSGDQEQRFLGNTQACNVKFYLTPPLGGISDVCAMGGLSVPVATASYLDLPGPACGWLQWAPGRTPFLFHPSKHMGVPEPATVLTCAFISPPSHLPCPSAILPFFIPNADEVMPSGKTLWTMPSTRVSTSNLPLVGHLELSGWAVWSLVHLPLTV